MMIRDLNPIVTALITWCVICIVGTYVLVEAQGLPVFNRDGAPTAQRDEARFPHMVVDSVRFAAAVDSVRVSLRTASTEGRTAIAYTDTLSYVVLCSKSDSVLRLTGSEFVIWYPTAFRGKMQQFIAVGN